MSTQALAERITKIPCTVHCEKVSEAVDLAGLNEFFASLPCPSILGGNEAKVHADGFSYWAAQPRAVFEFHLGARNPFGKLEQALATYTLRHANPELPEGIFCGGWVGYFGYELGRYIERIPETASDDIKIPLIRLCFYDRLIAYDHKNNCFWLVALELPGDDERPGQKLAGLKNYLRQSQEIRVPELPAGELEKIDFSVVRSNMSRQYYLDTIRKIRRYIYDGLVYQVNFSQRFESEFNSRPIELFGWQNCHNPSGYSAYIGADDFTIVSASPEMFVTICRGRISTKPIKGTRRRLAELTNSARRLNERNFNELLNCAKEQAELNMIIDLERNDLVKICRYGTRKVIQPRTIEAYPTVFHAVATVAGQLRYNVSFSDILKAMFPGGSITGAPKVSAMQIIDETEPTARGVYTGSIGYIGIDGTVCLNLAIRTIIIKNSKAFVQAGGGIVADSDPEAEWDETITKARALLAGIRATQSAGLQIADVRKINAKSKARDTKQV